MRPWRAAFGQAIRANPTLSATLAFELGLLLYATLKSRHGRSPAMPPAKTIIEAVPLLAAAAISAPAITPRKRKRKTRS
jgi:hypothetical protein